MAKPRWTTAYVVEIKAGTFFDAEALASLGQAALETLPGVVKVEQINVMPRGKHELWWDVWDLIPSPPFPTFDVLSAAQEARRKIQNLWRSDG